MKVRCGVILCILNSFRIYAYRPSLFSQSVVMMLDHFPENFDRPDHSKGKYVKPSKSDAAMKVTSIPKLKQLIQAGYRVKDIDVRGNTTIDARHVKDIHPVVRALYERISSPECEPGARTDGKKIAVAIEGGEPDFNCTFGLLCQLNFEMKYSVQVV